MRPEPGRRLPYGERGFLAVLGLAAALSLALLLWHHVAWSRSVQEEITALDNLQQARRHVARGYFALERIHVGDRAVDSSEPAVRLDRAELVLQDWLEGRGYLLQMERRPPSVGPLQGPVGRYRSQVGAFRALVIRSLREPGGGSPAMGIERRAAFAALDRENDELALRIYDRIRRTAVRQERRLAAMLALWLTLFGGLGLVVSRTTRHRERDADALREREQQLRQAQKMEAVGTLAGGIAHDFNNVLAAMVASVELARLEAAGNLPAQEALEQALAAAARAKELTRRILTFSRQREQVRGAVPLDQVADEVCTLLRSTLPSTIEIRSELVHGASVTAWADTSQVYQVLMNLCVNAAHAMRERGGVLRVEVAPAPGVAVPGGRPGEGSVRLRVGDTGHGIAPDLLERIFEPFFSTKPPGEGSGLGLAVVHGIVTAHGGAVDVASVPGGGTTFDVYLPRAAPGAPAARASAPSAAPRTGQGERILVVDDEEWIVSSTRRLFERLGYVVVGLTDSAAALDEFRRRPDDFALVLTDQTMPRLTGIDLAREILALRPDVPVILMTGFSEQVTGEVARAAGIRTVVTKPFTLAEMSEAIRSSLA